jgi:hypothetical protein
MISRDELIKIAAGVLRDEGFAGSGGTFRLVGETVQWVVHFDKIPTSQRIDVKLGFDFQVENTSRRANDCPVTIYLHYLPGVDPSELGLAFDAEEPLYDVVRKEIILDSMAICARFVLDHLTLPTVRAAYRDGLFKSGFIHRDARAILEADGELPNTLGTKDWF